MIDGNLDLSCFECSGSVSLLPFTVVFNPHTMASSPFFSIWKSSHVLEHLWSDTVPWGVGTVGSSSMGIGGGPPPLMKSEAALRLGDAYCESPKRLSVVNELTGAIKHVENSDYGRVNDSIQQSTTIIAFTEKSSIKIIVDLIVNTSSLLSSYAEEEEDDDEDDDIKVEKAVDIGITGSSMFSWMGLGSSTQGTSESATVLSDTHHVKEAVTGKRKWLLGKNIYINIHTYV
jgi:hypothetical protein